MVPKGGNSPSHRSAAKPGVAMSSRPWGVLERARKNFSFANPLGLFCETATFKGCYQIRKC
jgi:hypothetical protein